AVLVHEAKIELSCSEPTLGSSRKPVHRPLVVTRHMQSMSETEPNHVHCARMCRGLDCLVEILQGLGMVLLFPICAMEVLLSFLTLSLCCLVLSSFNCLLQPPC